MTLSKSLVTRVISFVVAWLLCMLLLLMDGFLVLRLTLCSSAFLQAQVEEGQYVEIATDELRENYLSYGAAGGFDSKTMNEIVNQLPLYSDILRSIESMYGEKLQASDFESLEDTIYEELMENVRERNIRVTEEIETGVATLAQACRSDYEQRATLPFIHYIRPLSERIRKITAYALLGIAVCIAVGIWLLLSVHRDKRNGLAYICQSTIAAALLSCALPLLLHKLIPIKSINLQPKSLKVLLSDYVINLFDSIWPFAIAMAVTAILLCLVYALTGRRKKMAV